MKIFNEDTRAHFNVASQQYLTPGENEVDDEIGKALVEGAKAVCAEQEKAVRARLKLKDDDEIPEAERPKPIFRSLEKPEPAEASEAKPAAKVSATADAATPKPKDTPKATTPKTDPKKSEKSEK